MICVCGDPFSDHRHGVCLSDRCRLTPAEAMPGGEHCVSFRTAMFRSPDAAFAFWVSSQRQSERTAYIDRMTPGCYYILALEEKLSIGVRVGKIEARRLELDALAVGRQFINHSTTE